MISSAGGRDSAAWTRLGVSTATLAWTLAVITIVLVVLILAWLLWSGGLQSDYLVYLSVITNAVVGALILSRHPRNGVGWLLLVFSLVTGIAILPFAYGYGVLASHSSLPFAPIALWISTWVWIPPFGMGFAMIVLRFPDGSVQHGWRFVDWLAVMGTVSFMIAVALTPGRLYSSYPVDNPFGLVSAQNQLAALYGTGIALIGGAALTAVASLLSRYRRADHERRVQLKWVVLACVIVMVTLVYTAVAVITLHVDFAAAHTPFVIALNLVPLSIGVAILRHRLFDIDFIINRTIVYALLTAILGGLYVGGFDLIQRLFVAYTGQRSETAIVITAFVVAAAFTPVQKWSEKVVERRLGGRDPADRVEAFTSSIEAVVRVIDPHLAARRLVEECVGAFEAVGGTLYLDSYGHTRPFHTHGNVDGEVAVEVAVRHAERSLGRLLLGHRRGGAAYSERDREALQKSANVLGEALCVGAAFGHVSPPEPS